MRHLRGARALLAIPCLLQLLLAQAPCICVEPAMGGMEEMSTAPAPADRLPCECPGDPDGCLPIGACAPVAAVSTPFAITPPSPAQRDVVIAIVEAPLDIAHRPELPPPKV